MAHRSDQQTAVELLQSLGLKEYEARAFVALARVPTATAKDISDISEVPRTRVYDAVRVLEEKGLVEIQHSNPQVFRAVTVEEAAATLRAEYNERTEQLEETLRELDAAESKEPRSVIHEVWSLSGASAIANRTIQLVQQSEAEVILVVGDETVLNDKLIYQLTSAQDREVTVIVGTPDAASKEAIQSAISDGSIFISGLEWMTQSASPTDNTQISRLLLVDQTNLLVSTVNEANPEQHTEQAIFGRGFDNGLVAIARRLMATGLLAIDDPGYTE